MNAKMLFNGSVVCAMILVASLTEINMWIAAIFIAIVAVCLLRVDG